MTDAIIELGAARAAFERGDWLEAVERFHAAEDLGMLSADDLRALAESVWWVGAIEESRRAFEGAYWLARREGRPRHAAMSAVFLAMHDLNHGGTAIGSGW